MKQSGADMFMLMDVDQFVSFDLTAIAESIASCTFFVPPDPDV